MYKEGAEGITVAKGDGSRVTSEKGSSTILLIVPRILKSKQYPDRLSLPWLS